MLNSMLGNYLSIVFSVPDTRQLGEIFVFLMSTFSKTLHSISGSVNNIQTLYPESVIILLLIQLKCVRKIVINIFTDYV